MRSIVIMLVMMAISLQGAYAIPAISSIGAEKTVGSTGRLADIDVDSNNRPHIACDVWGSGYVYFYDKVDDSDTWLTAYYNSGGSQFFNPHIEINKDDQAWISGVMWYPGGAGIVVRNNMATSPSTVAFMNDNYKGILPIANLSLDPRWSNQCLMNWTAGYWQLIGWNGSVFTDNGSGNAGGLHGGEKHDMWVSKSPYVNSKDDVAAAWHFCTDAFYQNKLRADNGLGIQTWASISAYPAMGSDENYPAVVSDNEWVDDLSQQTAYIIGGYKGIVMNIWKGTDSAGNGSFLYSSTALKTIDAAGSTGHARFEPQAYPANKGGVWVAYTRGGMVWVAYVTSDGETKIQQALFAGTTPDVVVDTDGNLHFAYSNGGIKYRKVEVTGDALSGAAADMAIFVPAFTAAKRSDLDVLGTNLVSIDNGAAPDVSLGTAYGDVAVSTPVVHTFMITNSGRKALGISSISVDGDSQFELSVPQPTNVAPKSSESFDLTFTPVSATNYAAEVVIVNDSRVTNFAFNVSGSGAGPAIEVRGTNGVLLANAAATNLAAGTDFGMRATGAYVTNTFTIKNSGAVPMNLTEYTWSTGSNFEGVEEPSMIDGGATSNFLVRFMPATATTFTGMVTIVNSSTNNPSFIVNFAGTGQGD